MFKYYSLIPVQERRFSYGKISRSGKTVAQQENMHEMRCDKPYSGKKMSTMSISRASSESQRRTRYLNFLSTNRHL
jgi:hypothetical protein